MPNPSVGFSTKSILIQLYLPPPAPDPPPPPQLPPSTPPPSPPTQTYTHYRSSDSSKDRIQDAGLLHLLAKISTNLFSSFWAFRDAPQSTRNLHLHLAVAMGCDRTVQFLCWLLSVAKRVSLSKYKFNTVAHYSQCKCTGISHAAWNQFVSESHAPWLWATLKANTNCVGTTRFAI